MKKAFTFLLMLITMGSYSQNFNKDYNSLKSLSNEEIEAAINPSAANTKLNFEINKIPVQFRKDFLQKSFFKKKRNNIVSDSISLESLARFLKDSDFGKWKNDYNNSGDFKLDITNKTTDLSLGKDTIFLGFYFKNQNVTLKRYPEDSNKSDGNNFDLTDRQEVLKKLQSIGISIGNPEFIFITRIMFDGLQAFGYINQQRCMLNKYDKQLPGEYILLYDMKNGDYYTLKKKIRKPITSDKKGKGCKDSIGCKDCCVGIEYYKWKKSMWYTPPVGAQFKVELMNYSTLDSFNLSFTYRDNFLEDEAKFKSILETASKSTSKDLAKASTDKTNTVMVSKPKSTDSIAINLLRLRNDLNYYNNNFPYNSSTVQKHLQNLQYINNKILEKFGITLDALLGKYKIQQENDDTLNILMKEIEKLYNRVYNFKTYSFLAQKLKNHDYLDITFKDNKGNEINKEEMRLWGGFKIDFSTGVFLTGLKDDNFVFIDSTVKYRPFRDTSTSTSTLRDTTGKIAIKENSGKQKIGFGVLVHAYPRISNNYNIALSAGLSVNTETELNVMLGGSLLLGSTRRLVLTGGLIWGKVNKISNTVKPGVNRSNPLNLTSAPIFYTTTNNLVPMVSDTHSNWFFGISYNFTAH